MMKRFATLLFLLVNLILSADAHSQTAVYVDPASGSDGNSGAIGSPFRTIAKGIAGIPGGGIVYLRGGTYSISGTTRLTLSAVGTPGSMYRLWAYPGERP